MFEREDEIIDRIVRHLKQAVRLDPALDARVMERIAATPTGGHGQLTAVWRWLVTPRRISLSPLTGLALTAGLAALLLARPWQSGSPSRAPSQDQFRFIHVAPSATAVALVGDFNDWDPARTPMRALGHGVWTATVPLAPGRYRYAFLMNGAEWRADPTAPRVVDDEFGAPSSVVTVGGS